MGITINENGELCLVDYRRATNEGASKKYKNIIDSVSDKHDQFLDKIIDELL